MSRGLGATQRAVLAALPADGVLVTVHDLAAGVYRVPAGAVPSRGQLESVRRALLALEGRRWVELGYTSAAAGEADARFSTRRHLAARLTGGSSDDS